MSPLNFASLMSERPELNDAWRFLEAWIAEHGNVHVVPITRLAKAAKKVNLSPLVLTKALGVLLDHGLIREVYQVADYDGVLIEGDYESPDEVPPRVEGRLSQFVETSETDIVPVYR